MSLVGLLCSFLWQWREFLPVFLSILFRRSDGDIRVMDASYKHPVEVFPFAYHVSVFVSDNLDGIYVATRCGLCVCFNISAYSGCPPGARVEWRVAGFCSIKYLYFVFAVWGFLCACGAACGCERSNDKCLFHFVNVLFLPRAEALGALLPFFRGWVWMPFCPFSEFNVAYMKYP